MMEEPWSLARGDELLQGEKRDSLDTGLYIAKHDHKRVGLTCFVW